MDGPDLLGIGVNLFLGLWIASSIWLELWAEAEILILAFYWGIYSLLTLWVSRKNYERTRKRELETWGSWD